MISIGSATPHSAAADSTRGGRSGLGPAAICSLLTFLLVLVLLPLKYEVNDDFGMVLALTGSDGFTPGSDNRFISQILSQTLSWLYAQQPGVPWYGIALYAAIVLGITLFLSAWLVVPASGPAKGLILVVWLPTLGRWLYSPTFTAATLVLELGVFLRVLSWLASDRSFPLRGRFLTVCMALAYLWRAPLAIYAGVFALPLLPYLRARDVYAAVPCLAVLLALVCADQVGTRLATTPADREYSEYSALRAQFQDRPAGRVGPQTSRAIAAAGWTDDDHELIRSRWFLYDESLVNADTLSRFLSANRAAAPSLLVQARQALSAAWGATRNFLPAIVCGALGILWLRFPQFLGTSAAHRRALLALTLILAPLVGLLFYRFVARMALPISAFALGAMLVLHPGQGGREPAVVARHRILRSRLAWLLVAVAGASSLYAVRADVSTLRTDSSRKQFIQASVRDFLAAAASPPLLVQLDPRYGLSHDTIHPLRETRDLCGYRVLPAGTALRSPRYEAALASFGLGRGSEFLAWLMDNPDVRLVLFTPATDTGRQESRETVRLWESYFNRRVLSPNRGRLGAEAGPNPRVALQEESRSTNAAGERLTFYRLGLDYNDRPTNGPTPAR